MGRKQHEKVTVIGAYPGKRVRMIKNSYAPGEVSIPAGQSLSVDVYAPVGFISQTKALLLQWYFFSGATTGFKHVQVVQAGLEIGMLLGRQNVGTNFSKELYYRYGRFESCDEMMPATEDAQIKAQEMIIFDDKTPVTVKFYNATNVAENVAKRFNFWVQEEKVT